MPMTSQLPYDGAPSSAAHNRPDGRSSPSSGPRLYRRAIDLPKLVALWPHEIADTSAAGRLRLVSKLRRALRGERQRGLAGHWTYDLARHYQLLNAYRAETAALLKLRD